MRRIGAGVVAVVILLGAGFAIVTAVGALGSDSGPSDRVTGASSPPSGASTAPTVTPTSTPSSMPSSTPVTPAATPPPTTVPPPTAAAPSAAAPAKVLVVGDSDAGAFGPYLASLLDETGVAVTTVDYKVSSGLARPDFFDWPAHLREQVPIVDPDIVVVTFGGNDSQGLADVDGTFSSRWNDPVTAKDEWQPEYIRRAGEVMDLLAADGRTVVWVGIPNTSDDDRTARLAVQDEAVRAALATRPAIRFVDTWARFSSPNGGWAEYAIDPRDGQGKDVRADDDFHLNEAGAEILALDIAEVVTADLRTRGATI